MNKANEKKNKKMRIIPIIIAFIVVGVIVGIYYFCINSVSFNVMTFKHKDISKLKFKEGSFWIDSTSTVRYPFHYYSKKDVDYDGRYFVGRFFYPDGTVIIEENVFKDGGPDNPETFSRLKAVEYLNFIGDVYKIPQDVRKAP